MLLLLLQIQPIEVDILLEGGGGRIRTYGRFTASGFQDQRIRPLCHAPGGQLSTRRLYDDCARIIFRFARDVKLVLIC